jgi:small subunit ribosomal protein S17
MGERKNLTGTVVSDKMTKTVIVSVETMTRHRIYRKTIRRRRKYVAHDEQEEAKVGDTVRIEESRPVSRTKRWRVAEIVERGEVPEIAPEEIDREYLTLTREREAPPPPKAAAEPEAAVEVVPETEVSVETAEAEAEGPAAESAAEAEAPAEEAAAAESAAVEAEAEASAGESVEPEEPDESEEEQAQP